MWMYKSIGKSPPFFTAFLSMSFGNASKRILLLVVNFKKIYKVYYITYIVPINIMVKRPLVELFIPYYDGITMEIFQSETLATVLLYIIELST